ncbi:MAG: metallophosphoesterase family protein, partial [Verrucomicrobiales bacterium]|nr:metallophosphoesterase family protein [Verrucomicrobiales bacterium]
GSFEGWVPPWQPDGPYEVTVRSIEFSGAVVDSEGPVTLQGSRPRNPRFGQPLERNGGFEEDLAHWSILEGSPQVLPSGTTKGRPHGGDKFLHGGLNRPGDGIVRQELDLGDLGFADPELSEAVVRADAWLRNQQNAGLFDDQVYARVVYLGADGTELGSVRCLVAGDRSWLSRSFGGRLPKGTRRLGLEVVGRHRRDADNDSMADDLTVRLDPLWPPVQVAPTITKLPMLQDVRRDAMRLLWETDSNRADHSVEWGRHDTGERTFHQVETIQIDDTHFVHRATLEGLEAETEYTYRVRSGDSVTPAYTFRTAPRPGTPFVAAWWGDNHQGTDVLRTHVENLLKHSPDLICVAGDMVNFGNSLEEWHEYWFKPLEHLNAAQTVPVIFARGNHDGEHALSYAYSTLPGNESWFAFDYGNARMIFLDSEAPGSMAPEQREWLRLELLRPETQQAAFRIVCFHKPPWSQFWNGGGHTQEEFVLREWIPLFRLNGVDLVISGHEHAYHRGARDGVTYVVTGGGGGFLDTERVAHWRHVQVEYTQYHFDIMTVNGRRLTWETYDLNHDLLDEFTLVSRVPSVRISESGGKVLLQVEGRPGLRYQIEAGTELGTWAPEGDLAIPDDGGAVSWIVAPGDGRRFLRVVPRP